MTGLRSGGELALDTAVTISRTMGNGPDEIWLSITDRTSRAGIIEVRMTLADFALALTGRAEVESTGRVWPVALGRLGLVRENASRTLTVQTDAPNRGKAWRDYIDTQWRAQFPDDPEQGWAIFGLDKDPNPHRRGRTDELLPTYQIAIERYVDPT